MKMGVHDYGHSLIGTGCRYKYFSLKTRSHSGKITCLQWSAARMRWMYRSLCTRWTHLHASRCRCRAVSRSWVRYNRRRLPGRSPSTHRRTYWYQGRLERYYENQSHTPQTVSPNPWVEQTGVLHPPLVTKFWGIRQNLPWINPYRYGIISEQPVTLLLFTKRGKRNFGEHSKVSFLYGTG